MSKREYDEIRNIDGGWTLSKRYVPDLAGTEYRLDSPQWINASYVPDGHAIWGLRDSEATEAIVANLRSSLIRRILADEHVRAAVEEEFARRLEAERWRSFQ